MELTGNATQNQQKIQHATIWRILIIWFLSLISRELQPKTSSSWAISSNKVAWLIFFMVLKLTKFLGVHLNTRNDYFHCKKFTQSPWKLKIRTSNTYLTAFMIIMSLQTLSRKKTPIYHKTHSRCTPKQARIRMKDPLSKVLNSVNINDFLFSYCWWTFCFCCSKRLVTPAGSGYDKNGWISFAWK